VLHFTQVLASHRCIFAKIYLKWYLDPEMPSEYFGIFARRAASREGRGEQQLGKGLVRRRQLGRTARSIQATSYRDHAIRPRISLSLALAVMVVTRSTPELAGRCGALLVAAPARTAKNLYRAHRSPAEPSSRGKRKEELGGRHEEKPGK
jgi:hypothetical protein